MAKLRVLIADSESLFSEALAMALWWSSDLEVQTEFPVTGSGAVEKAVELKPDVALVDYWMPEVDGPTVASMITQEELSTKTILLSWLYGPLEIKNGLEAGAVGFLPKTVKVDHVATAIRRAHAGESPVYADQLAELIRTLTNRGAEVRRVRQRLANLTPREMTCLRLLGHGKSISDIAAELNIAPHTVKLHFHNLVMKTEAITKEQALAMARFCGLIRT